MKPRRVLSGVVLSLNTHLFGGAIFILLLVATAGLGRASAQVTTSNVPFLEFQMDFHRGGTEVETKRYTLAGPIEGSRLLPGLRLMRVGGRDQYFGVDRNNIVELDRATETFRSVDYNEVSPTLVREGHATSVAYDAIGDQVALVSLGSEGFLHNYSPATDSWALAGDLDNWDFNSIVHHRAEDVLYGVRCSNLGGAATGSLQIARIAADGQPSLAVTVPDLTFGVGFGGHSSEMVSVGEYLVLLLEPAEDYHYSEGPEESRIYLIHPGRREVTLTYRMVWEEWPPNSAPMVRMAFPENGARFNSGLMVVLKAAAHDPDRQALQVEFIANGHNLGKGSPSVDPAGTLTYQLSWKPLDGTYSVIARASDGIAISVSTPISIQVQPAENEFELSFYPIQGLSVGDGHVFTRKYRPDGPREEGRLLPGMRVVHGTDGNFYGTHWHEVYKINGVTGARQTMMVGSGEDELSWPMGVAFDTGRNRVLLVSLGGEGFLYGYSIDTGLWSTIASMDNRDYDSIIYHPSLDLIFGYGHDGDLYKLNSAGEVVGKLDLPHIGLHVGPGGYQTEMALLGSKIALVVEPDSPFGIQGGEESRIYVIDPNSGEFELTYRKIWPTQAENIPPSVTITHPTDGMNFEVSSTITLSAAAHDLDGSVIGVDFFVNGVRLGAGSDWIAGTNQFGFLWTPVTNGTYSLYARAMDERGATTDSTPVGIIVGPPEPTHNVVGIVPSDPEGTEVPPWVDVFDPVSFIVSRSGDRSRSVTVFYSIHGTAENGVDYHEIPAMVTIPAGEGSAEILIIPVEMNPTIFEPNEKMETVGIRLEPSPMAGPLPDYEIDGPRRTAAGVIYERAPRRPANGELEVAIPGAGFTYHDEVQFLVAGYHSSLDIATVDYYVDGQKVGSSNHETEAVPTGGYTVHSFDWSTATAGHHVLQARSTLANGEQLITSEIPFIVFGTNSAPAFVERELPESYVPGSAFTVTLQARPPAGTKAYAIEDLPPAGWEVIHVFHEGTVDPVSRKVKFGPFTNAQWRTLSYRVTPPVSATGRAEFSGNSSRDGLLFPIAGERVIEVRSVFHPADADRNNKITITELTAYAAAWKGGDTWPTGESPIPVGYVTRAAQIWKQGESYRFNVKEEAPFCWESNLIPLPPKPLFEATSWNFVQRIAPSSIAPGGGALVRITAAPFFDTEAYAVEESVPAGWSVSQISEGGTFDPRSRRIRWGVFLDEEARAFSYVLTAPEGRASVAKLAGTLSVDGGTQAIGGAGFVTASDAATAVRLVPERDSSGALQLKIDSAPGQTGVVECSSDLVHWSELQPINSANGSVHLVDPNAGEMAVRFYRFRAE